MNRDELDQERPVPFLEDRPRIEPIAVTPGTPARWRPASTESPASLELGRIYAGVTADAIRRHVAAARTRARGILTAGEIAALEANGLGWLVDPDPVDEL